MRSMYFLSNCYMNPPINSNLSLNTRKRTPFATVACLTAYTLEIAYAWSYT